MTDTPEEAQYYKMMFKRHCEDLDTARRDIEALESELHEARIAYDKLFDEAAAGFAERDSRITILEQLVSGVYDAEWDGLQVDRGDWFEIRDSLLQ